MEKVHDLFRPSETSVAHTMDPSKPPIDEWCGSGDELLGILLPQHPSPPEAQGSTMSADHEPQPTHMDESFMETDPQPVSHASTMENSPASPGTRTWGNLQERECNHSYMKFETESIGDLTVDLKGKAAMRGIFFEVERDHPFKPEILLGSETKDLMGQATNAHVLLSLIRSHPDAKETPIVACKDHDQKDGHVLQTINDSMGQYIEVSDAASSKLIKCLHLKNLPIENGDKIVLPDIKSVCYNTKCSGKNHENIWQLVVQCEAENGWITGRTSINFKSIAHIRAPDYWKNQRLRRALITPGKRMKMQKKTKKTINGTFTKNVNIPLTASSPEALAEKERKLLISAQKIEAGE